MRSLEYYLGGTMTIAERLKKLRLEKGITQAELANRAKTTQQSVQRIEAGLSDGKRVVEKIAGALQIHPSWLLFGEKIGTEGNDLYYNLPILPWQNIKLITPDEYDTLPKFPMPKTLCSFQSYILIVKGDSMESQQPGKKTFLPGDKIAIDPDKTLKCWSFVIAQIDNASEPVFKQYFEDGPKKYLKPLNPQYPTIEMSDDMKILGVVFAHFNINLAD